NIFQASEQNLTKSNAADGNFSRLGVWAVNNRKCQKSFQVGVQKVDRLVRFCSGTKKLLEQSYGKAMFQCSRSICADMQAIPLQTVGRRSIPFKHCYVDARLLQTLCKAETTCASPDNHYI